MLVRLLGRIFRRRGRERLANLCCDAGAEPATAERAAAWAAGFHPGLSVAVESGTASLASEDYSEAELRTIWRSAIVNEQLHARGAGRRAAIIEALVR